MAMERRCFMGATLAALARRIHSQLPFRVSRATILLNCSGADFRSSAISAAMMSGAGSALVSVRLLSLIQKRSRLSLSRFNSRRVDW
jgi:hypothetical protein